MSDDLLDDATFAEEFPQVEDQIYLDHAGTTLFAKSQISKLQDDLFPSGGKILGNPHSHNPSSRYSADLVEQVRLRILQFFNATSEDYDVIFTSGATAAIKVVVEAFDFASSPCERTEEETSGAFVYTQENHTSVFGARGVAFARGASVFCVDADDLLSTTALISSSCSSNLDDENGTAGRETSAQERCGNGLFAYPAQCNFSGRKFPLEWSSEIKNGGNQLVSKLESLLTGSNQLSCTREGEGVDTCRSSAQHNQQPSGTQHLPKEWFVLLDAASYAATNPLDLSKWSPDFVCVSFYKIFGFPTGVGALLVRKSSAERVLTRKQYFGGGTVAVSLTRSNFVKFRPELHERLEDGTIPFLSIISLLRGFDTLTRLAGNMIRIQNHVSSLVQSAYKGLSQLRHRDGSAVVELYYGAGSAVASPSSSCSASAAGASNATNTAAYSDEGLASGLGRINKNAHDSSHAGSSGDDIDSASSKSTNGTTADHGSALAFSVLRPGGAYVGFSEVSKMLELFDIHVRTGCFCNPGACQKWLRMSDERILGNHQAGHVCGDNVDLVDGQPTGCIRISFGYMSRHRDVDRFLKAMQECFVDSSITAAAAASSGDANNTQQIDKDPTTSAARRPPPPQLGSTGRHQCHVTDLLVYPVKSCGAFRPAARRWPVTDSGFAFDRTWMITDGRGVALSQKRESRLCFVMPRVDLEVGLLWLHVDGLEDISVPLIPTGVDDPKLGRSASICTSKVCGDRVDVLDCGDAVSEWLSDALCRDDNPRLLRINPDFQRLARKAQAGTKLSLANEAQFLLISRASVRALMEDLSARHCKKEDAASDAMSEVHNNITGDGLDEEELISRFRPNIVIDGSLDPYEEEEAENFFFLPSQENGSSPVTLQNTGPCSRCQMVCIDQQTGEKTKEPLVTLAATRGPKIPFGVHCRFKLPDESDEKNTNVCPLKDTWLEILSSVTFNTKYKAQI